MNTEPTTVVGPTRNQYNALDSKADMDNGLEDKRPRSIQELDRGQNPVEIAACTAFETVIFDRAVVW